MGKPRGFIKLKTFLFVLALSQVNASAFNCLYWLSEIRQELKIASRRKLLLSTGATVERVKHYQNGEPIWTARDEDKSLISPMQETYRILNTRPEEFGSPRSLALTHPELPKYLELLKELGYEFFVDLTFHGKCAGFQSDDARVVVISPDSIWAVFIHEFQHALVDIILRRVGGFENFKKKVKREGSVLFFLSDPYFYQLYKYGLEWDDLIRAAESDLGYMATTELCAMRAYIRAGGNTKNAFEYASRFILKDPSPKRLELLKILKRELGI